MFQGQLIYFLYFTHCLLAPIDLSKIYMLRDNKKLAAMFIGLLCCFQNLIQGLVLDLVIFFVFSSDYDKNPIIYYFSKSVEITLTLVAMWFIYRNSLRSEMSEVKLMN
jgi:hypothetical protein